MKTILALGADMKNRFLIAEGKDLRFGPNIGDLSDAKNYDLFKKEIQKIIKNTHPSIIAHDLHPGYFSTQFATAGTGLSSGSLVSGKDPSPVVVRVQHHHAHIASVMAEHGLKGAVIGVSFDGTGFGADSKLWGGEFLLVTRKGFKRLAHLKYIKMPGGDKAIHEPWRMVLSILGKQGMPFVKSVNNKDKNAVLAMMAKGINSPLTSSAGRLFDAAAALLGICERASFEAEGPRKLERICDDGEEGNYKFYISKSGDKYVIGTKSIFQGMIRDLKKGKKKGLIAAKFHNSLIQIIVETVAKLSKELNIKDIALSGGVFQNQFLREKTIKRLKSLKFNVFINSKTPVNDLNVALGQYYVLSGSGKN